VDDRSILEALIEPSEGCSSGPRSIRLGVHDLRRTCASLLLLDGVSDREVMELLGHSSTHITMNIYAHVLEKSKRRLAARIDSLFSGNRG
jgi:integrase